MTVRRLLAEMDASEFLDWIAYDRITHPEGWHQAALVAASIYNAAGVGRRFWKPAEFLPRRIEAERSPAEILGKLRMFAAAHNAALARRGGGGGVAFA